MYSLLDKINDARQMAEQQNKVQSEQMLATIHRELDAEKDKVNTTVKSISDAVSQLVDTSLELDAGLKSVQKLITNELVQSDKLGYDWKITKFGDMEVKKEYVQQENPVGTADNPIQYHEGVELINNAYYIKDGKRQVYMDGQWAEF